MSNMCSRDRLAELLNEDLSREYQAIVSYVVYSQVLKGRGVHEHRGTARSARSTNSSTHFYLQTD